MLLVSSAEIFLPVCRTQSVLAAAKQLGLIQPAVSAAVARLEKELGVDLVRRTRPIEIAPEVVTLGKLLVTTADKMERVITDIQCRQNLLPGIRIGLHFPLLLPSRERKTILIIHAFDLRK